MQSSFQYNVVVIVIFISILLILFTCGRLLLGDIFFNLKRKKNLRQADDTAKVKPESLEMPVKLPDELEKCLPPTETVQLQSSDSAECYMIPEETATHKSHHPLGDMK